VTDRHHPVTGLALPERHRTPTDTVPAEVRDAARLVGYLIASRAEVGAALIAAGSTSLTVTALRATAEAIAAARTSWDDLPAEEWRVLANNLRHLTTLPELIAREHAACARLALHYRHRAGDTIDPAAIERARAPRTS
jgi:hypothetical protein